MSKKDYNLCIEDYSYNEICDALGIPPNPNATDMLNAKKRVLQFHPDKTRADTATYFIFFKKMYDRVYGIYLQNTRHERDNDAVFVPDEKPEQLQQQHQQKEGFQDWFNSQFNEVVGKKDTTKNEWYFQQNEPTVSKARSVKDMHRQMEEFRKKQSAVVVHKEVSAFKQNVGSKFIEDDDDEEQGYIEPADPFSKFTFSDIRKVYRDNNINSVSEEEFTRTGYKPKQTASTYRTNDLDGSVTKEEFAQIDALNKRRQMEAQHQYNEKMYKYKQKLDDYEKKSETVRRGYNLLQNTPTNLLTNGSAKR